MGRDIKQLGFSIYFLKSFINVEDFSRICSLHKLIFEVFKIFKLQWHYVSQRIKVTIYYVTNVNRSILNIVSTKLQHKNINKQKDRDAFDLQNLKTMGQSFYFDNFHSLILADNIVFYLSFIIGNLLKYIAVTARLLQRKLSITPL